MYWIEIQHLDGHPWYKTLIEPVDAWRWITACMVDHFQCDYTDVEMIETEDQGDVLLVKGEEVRLLPPPNRWTREGVVR